MGISIRNYWLSNRGLSGFTKQNHWIFISAIRRIICMHTHKRQSSTLEGKKEIDEFAEHLNDSYNEFLMLQRFLFNLKDAINNE